MTTTSASSRSMASCMARGRASVTVTLWCSSGSPGGVRPHDLAGGAIGRARLPEVQRGLRRADDGQRQALEQASVLGQVARPPGAKDADAAGHRIGRRRGAVLDLVAQQVEPGAEAGEI